MIAVACLLVLILLLVYLWTRGAPVETTDAARHAEADKHDPANTDSPAARWRHQQAVTKSLEEGKRRTERRQFMRENWQKFHVWDFQEDRCMRCGRSAMEFEMDPNTLARGICEPRHNGCELWIADWLDAAIATEKRHG